MITTPSIPMKKTTSVYITSVKTIQQATTRVTRVLFYCSICDGEKTVGTITQIRSDLSVNSSCCVLVRGDVE